MGLNASLSFAAAAPKKLLTAISVTDIVFYVKEKHLTPAVFHILLALSTEERHGYGIMKQVEADSLGKVKMGPGTLYGSIKRMLDAALIEEIEPRVDPAMDDARRIYYRLTGNGERALKDEVQRYSHLVKLTKKLGLAYAG